MKQKFLNETVAVTSVLKKENFMWTIAIRPLK